MGLKLIFKNKGDGKMDYIIDRQPMLCGHSEAEERRYKKVIGKSGRIWLYAIQDNPADNIYVSGGKNSDGFGGRTLSFTLEDGTIEELKAPWHTNSDDLYSNTGVDLRDKHLTFVVVGKGRKTYRTRQGWVDKIIEVLYQDEKPTIGEFDRGEKLAQPIANKLKQTIYCYSQSQGGSSNSPIEPKEEGNA